jgi:hypothetical protein
MDSNTCSLRGTLSVDVPSLPTNTEAVVQVPFPGAMPGDMIVLSPWVKLFTNEGGSGTITFSGSVTEPDKVDVSIKNHGGPTFDPATFTISAVDLRATGSI